MGTAETAPAWVSDIQLMEHFGWTEKQLMEEVSLRTVARIKVYLELKAKAAEVKAKQEQLRSARV